MRRFSIRYLLAAAAVVLAAAGPARALTTNSAFADQAFAGVNQQRTANGLPALARIRVAELAAQLHAIDMANREYMDHYTKATSSPVVPDPQDYPDIAFAQGWGPADRLIACGYPANSNGYGENIAMNYGYGAQSPSVSVSGWMNSPLHRENILRPGFVGAGMGCAVSASGKVYYAQDFLFVAAGWPTLARNADLVSGTPSTTDTVSPNGWAGATASPRGSKNPTVTIRVSDGGSGLAVASAKYRYSTNGGTTWSAWRTASCTGTNGTTAAQTVRAASVPFGSINSTKNRIQFQVKDVAGNTGMSPTVIVYPR